MTTKTIPALSARTQFGALVDDVFCHNKRYFVEKKGEIKVVILSLEDYYKNIIKTPEVLKKVQEEAKKTGLNKINDKERNKEIKDTRKSLWN